MKTLRFITPPDTNPHSHLLRSRWLPSSRRLLCSAARSWLILIALVAMASTARAHIVGVTDCNCTNITIQLADFPEGQFVAELGGVNVGGTYDFGTQTIVLNRTGLAGG